MGGVNAGTGYDLRWVLGPCRCLLVRPSSRVGLVASKLVPSHKGAAWISPNVRSFTSRKAARHRHRVSFGFIGRIASS